MIKLHSSSAPGINLSELSGDGSIGVSQIDDDTFLWTEDPNPNLEQLQAFARDLTGLTINLEHYYLIADLSKAGRPDAPVRSFLVEFFRQQTKLAHLAVVTGDNMVLSIAARFVLSQIGVRSSSFNKTRAQAAHIIEDTKRHDRQQENDSRSSS